MNGPGIIAIAKHQTTVATRIFWVVFNDNAFKDHGTDFPCRYHAFRRTHLRDRIQEYRMRLAAASLICRKMSLAWPAISGSWQP